jgi:hypothetical protein
MHSFTEGLRGSELGMSGRDLNVHLLVKWAYVNVVSMACGGVGRIHRRYRL